MHLLLLPGMDGTGRLFEPLLRCLPPALVPVVVAYPPDRPCGYAELLPLVEAAVPEGQEFLVLGESFSGPLALLLADRRPPGLRGVILCASFARSPVPSWIRRLRPLVRPICFRLTPPRLVRGRLLGRFATDQLVGMLDDALADIRLKVLAARARAILAVDVGAEVRSCPVPILYLAGGEDRVVSPSSLAHIRRLRPGVEAVTIAGPHMVLQAAPEEAARVIQAFASSTAGPDEAAGP